MRCKVNGECNKNKLGVHQLAPNTKIAVVANANHSELVWCAQESPTKSAHVAQEEDVDDNTIFLFLFRGRFGFSFSSEDWRTRT